GGGGGGGGGGATRKVTNCCLGRTSVNHSGTKTRTETRKHCNTRDTIVAHAFCFRCPPLVSSRLSANKALCRIERAGDLVSTSCKTPLVRVSPFSSSWKTGCIFMVPPFT